MRAVLTLVLALAVHLSAIPTPVHAQPLCRFVLGFATLRDLVGAQKVGTCLEDEHFNLENGNAEQLTAGGLLVWRKVDNFTAFTDGGTSWINGPNGLQSRPNNDRFSWERDPVQSAASPPAAARPPNSSPAAVAPATSAPSGQVTGVLVLRCLDIVRDTGTPPDIADQLFNSCQTIADTYGARGVDCYEQSLRAIARDTGPGRSANVSQIDANLRACLTGGVAPTAGAPPAVPAPPTAAPRPVPTPTLPPSRLTGALKNRCMDIVTNLTIASGVAPPPSMTQQCWDLGEQYGPPGVDCFDDAMRFAVTAPRPRSGATARLLAGAVQERLDNCLLDLR